MLVSSGFDPTMEVMDVIMNMVWTNLIFRAIAYYGENLLLLRGSTSGALTLLINTAAAATAAAAAAAAAVAAACWSEQGCASAGLECRSSSAAASECV